MEESMRKRLDATLERFEEIDRELSSPEIAEDVAKLTSLSKERAGLEEAYNKYKEYLKYEQTSKDALELLETVNEADMVELAKEERKDALNNMERLEDEFKILLLPKDPNDDKNIIVEIRGAVGGDEANIFAGDLMRMYVKYAETQGWKIQLLDAALGASGGYSYVSFMVKGENVYSKLKFESGGHRVQRVRPRDVSTPPSRPFWLCQKPRKSTSRSILMTLRSILIIPRAPAVRTSIRPNQPSVLPISRLA